MKVFYDLSSLPVRPFPTALALGMFDGVHLGHQQVIRKALSYQESCCPGVLTFAAKGIRPAKKSNQRDILTLDGRLKQFEIQGVQEVYLPQFAAIREMEAETFVREILVKKLNAKVLCCGEDFRFGKDARGDVALLKELVHPLDIVVEVVPSVEKEGSVVSSTRIRKCLQDGDVEQVNLLLGYPYFIEGEVVYGNQIGRTIDCPTINQKLSQEICLPKFGVYASQAEVHGNCYPAITNIGVKPTIEGDRTPLAETHVIGLNENLYGEQVTVFLHHFIREEMKFPSVESLSQQIQKDIQTALQFVQI